MAKRQRALKVDIACPKITITWKVLITGRASNDQLAAEVEQIFKLWFGKEMPPAGQGSWPIGTCRVYFKIDVAKALNRDPTKKEREGARDIIELRDPKSGGGGDEMDITTAPAPALLVHPDSDTGGMNDLVTAHELGHGLGIDDPPGGKWLTDKVGNNKIQDKNIEEILNKLSKEDKKAINDCCGSHLTVALKQPLTYPAEKFLATNPRDPAYAVFPPDSKNPFTETFAARMVAWQRLVNRYGLTRAYERWSSESPSRKQRPTRAAPKE